MNYSEDKGSVVTKVWVHCLGNRLIIINRLIPMWPIFRSYGDYIIKLYKN